MAIKTPTAVTVTNAATALVDTTGTTSDPQPVLVYNSDASVVVYLGGSDVTAATGIPLAALATMSFALGSGDDLYGITSASTAAVRILKRG